MNYTMNFGRLSSQPSRRKLPGDALRIAVLGDFSGRANARNVEVGEALVSRKPRRVDVDNFEKIFRQWNAKLQLPLGDDGAGVDVQIESLDDFHPDQLYGKLDIFRELGALRSRLKSSSTFAAAAAEMQKWPAFADHESTTPAIPKALGSAMPAGKLDDFARLIGQSPIATRKSPVDELIKRVIAPHIVPASSPDQAAMIAAVDEALSATMRRILHHPDLQALEALWRAVDLMTRELETGTQLQLILYDITAEEIAADLSSTDELESSGFYRLLVEKPMADQQVDPPSVLVANYIFDLTPPHAELLGRISKVAAAAGAPFIAGVTPDCLIKRDPDEVHPLVTESWATLRQMPQANYVGLTSPRFMLRWPYGAATEPIESFDFEEFTRQSGLGSMLWANGSILAGLLLGKTFSEQGLSGMKLGSLMSLGDIPFYYYTDDDGDQIALPNTERMVTEPTAVRITSQNFMPVLPIRGRPEVRLGSFNALGGALLAGPWAPLEIQPDAVPSSSLDAAPVPPVDAPEASIEEIEAREASDAENELDALLADVSPPPTDSDAELDALLAGFEQDANEKPALTEDGMDPELAALLSQL